MSSSLDARDPVLDLDLLDNSSPGVELELAVLNCVKTTAFVDLSDTPLLSMDAGNLSLSFC